MHYNRQAALLLSILILSYIPIPVQSQNDYDPPHDQVGPAVDTLRFRSFHVDIAPAEILADQMDMYYFGIKVAAANDLKAEDSLIIHKAPTSTLSLLLNPAQSSGSELNPFSIKEIRQAMQFLVNREFIVNEIYRGMAVPMITQISSFDHDYLTLYDLIHESNFPHDPDTARNIIEIEMLNAGAEMVDGKWMYNDNPVVIKFIIRVEDERRDIGDLIRSELEKLGFTVLPSYQQFGPAIFTVYTTDPQLLEWHMYTEGWSKGTADKFDAGTINQMCAPWLGNMPGWQELGYWQYENDEIDQLGKKIFSGDFKNEAERNSLYLQTSELCLDESVRIWLANVITSLPAKSNIIGITSDVISGPKSLWTPRNAYIEGKNELTIGNVWIWTARTTWNPIGGFGDLYGIDIWKNMNDPPITRHPFSGLPMPFRAEYNVVTNGPENPMQVPSDAVIWNTESDSWENIGSDTTAVSKVTLDYSKYFSSKWHHGENIDMSDVLYSIYQIYDLTYDDKKSGIEFAIATTTKPYLDSFKGFRVVDDNTIEIYLDFWHFSEDYIADYASLTGLSMPWEILYSMDILVFENGQAAYSDTAAQRFNVPWISLVMEKDSRLVRNQLRELVLDEKYPANVFSINGKQFGSSSHATSRYEASMNWFEKYNMLVISNGPFYLAKYDPPAQYAELKAYRDPTYPFKPGDFHFGTPDLLSISNVDASSILIGEDNEYKITMNGVGNLGLRFTLINLQNNEIVINNFAQKIPPNEFVIDLDSTITSSLKPGLYKLILAGFSDSISPIHERIIVLEATHEILEQTESIPEFPEIESENEPSSESSDTFSISSYLPVIVGLIVVIIGISVINGRQSESNDQSNATVKKTITSSSKKSKKLPKSNKKSKKSSKKTTPTRITRKRMKSKK